MLKSEIVGVISDKSFYKKIRHTGNIFHTLLTFNRYSGTISIFHIFTPSFDRLSVNILIKMKKPQIRRKKAQSVFQTIYLLALAIVVLNTTSFAQTPVWNWAKAGSGAFNDNSSRTVTDNSGNVYVVGSFASTTIAFGAITLTNASGGIADLFIVKYDPNGNVIWAKSAGGTYTDYASAIAIDNNNNVCIAGSF